MIFLSHLYTQVMVLEEAEEDEGFNAIAQVVGLKA